MKSDQTQTFAESDAGSRIIQRALLSPTYRVRLAETQHDLHQAQALRFSVFNLELGEGLSGSYTSGRDEDAFDEICEHLLVEDLVTGQTVGTYRMQTGCTAALNLGYYSSTEFELSRFESFRAQIIELGRACVHKDHRNMVVLGLLWRGIVDYARRVGGRYFIGCSSINTQDHAVGATLYSTLCRRHLAPIEWHASPKPAKAVSLATLVEDPPKVPRLLSTYLSIGAKICGQPAIDTEFRTIDFLTVLDMHNLPAPLLRQFNNQAVL